MASLAPKELMLSFYTTSSAQKSFTATSTTPTAVSQRSSSVDNIIFFLEIREIKYLAVSYSKSASDRVKLTLKL
jgi:hypothetical protein